VGRAAKLAGGPAELAGAPAEPAGGPAELAGAPAELAGAPAEPAGGPPEPAGGPAELASGPAELASGPAKLASAPPEPAAAGARARPAQPGARWERVAELARRQGGHVSTRQLITMGFTRRMVRGDVERGRLIPVHFGIYAVGHHPTNPIDRALGALLAVGPGAALSHGSAASLWGATPRWTTPLHVSCPRQRRLRGVIVHHRPALRGSDMMVHRGVRVLKPALVVLDLAPTLTGKRLQRVIDDLRMPRPYLRLEDLTEVTQRFPRHPGSRRLRGVIGLMEAVGEPTRSAWEQDWIEFAGRYELPAHEMNVRVHGRRVDVLFRAERVVVELDGWEAHRSYHAFVADRDADLDRLRHDILTVRLTHEHLRSAPASEAARLIDILQRRICASPAPEARPRASTDHARR
jgi:hypothetical protein